jgi:hypothetical protein
MSFFNMMVAKWSFWDGYLAWMFPLLMKIYERIEIPQDPYQSRVIGFLSERLLNLYLIHSKARIAYLPVVSFE